MCTTVDKGDLKKPEHPNVTSYVVIWKLFTKSPRHPTKKNNEDMHWVVCACIEIRELMLILHNNSDLSVQQPDIAVKLFFYMQNNINKKIIRIIYWCVPLKYILSMYKY